MRESDPGPELDQSRRLGLCRGVALDPEPLGRPPQQGHVAQRLSGRREDQALRLDRERLEATKEALLDEARQRPGVQAPESARQLRRREPSGQLQQGQGVPARLGDDPVPHLFVHPPGGRRVQQGAGVGVTQTVDHQHRQALQLQVHAGLSHCEHEGDRFGQEAPGHECENLH
jgi:hypothetical protein